MPDKLLPVAIVIGVHGVRGSVRVHSLLTDPETLFKLNPLTDEAGTGAYQLTRQGIGKDHFIATITGISDREAAENLRGMVFCVPRSALPNLGTGEYYEADLRGLAAMDDADHSKQLGIVLAMHDYGAGVSLEIQPPTGESFMLPFTNAYIPQVDLREGYITIIIPDGWLEKQ